MKIAIHHRAGSFSDRWIAYCEKQGIPYKLVNAFDSDIVEQLSDCDAFMWHHHHAVYKDVVAAKKILFALEHAGIKVFPDFKTGWHFDDKVAQKYLLEAIGAPLVPSYVFYDKQEALAWAKTTSYPKVFKLKGGAGSANVRLVRSEGEARKLIGKAFGKGFPQYDRFGALKERFRKFRQKQASFFYVLKGIARLLYITDFAKQQPNERGYAYFQEFIPNLDSDIRIQVIGEKIVGLKRYVRENDFRASGSGDFVQLDRGNVDRNILVLAIELNTRIQSSCLTIDFIYKDDEPLVVELSYGFPVNFYDECKGYWDRELNWYSCNVHPQDWIIDVICNNPDQ